MVEASQVFIGELLLESAHSDHPVKFQRIDGWRGLSQSRGRQDAVPGDHGTYPSVTSLRAALPITVSGFVRGQSYADVTLAISSMSNLLAQGAVLPMRVLEPDGWWVREVEVVEFVPEDPAGRHLAKFELDLTAPDPVRYRDPVVVGPVGVPTQVGGLHFPARFPWNFGMSSREAVPVVNDGTVPLYPVVTVQGGADSLTVHGGPRRVEVSAFDGTLVLDARNRRAFLNGGDITRHLLRRDWPQVPAGATHDFSFEAVNPASDTSLTVEYRIGAW